MDNADVDDALRRWTSNVTRDPLPALILWGREDPFLPPRLAEKLRDAIPGASLEIIEGADTRAGRRANCWRSGSWRFF
jgi:pimeloyl-ACP methyl ester carboxylesterase